MARWIIRIAILIAFLITVNANSQQFGVWKPLGETVFKTGVGQAVVGTSDHIYVARSANVINKSELWKGTLADNEIIWEQLESSGNLPSKGAFRNGTALAWDGDDYIYALLGGRGEDNFANPDGSCVKIPPAADETNNPLAQCSFFRYRIATNSWKKLDDSPHFQGAGDALVYVEHGDEHQIFAFLGGNEHKDNSAFARFNISAGNWHKLRFPTGWNNCTNDGASLAWDGGKYVYATQGECHEENGKENAKFARYDLDSETWDPGEKFSQNPLPDNGRNCGISDGGSLIWPGSQIKTQSKYLYLLHGGCAKEKNGGGNGLNDSFSRYDLDAGRWEPLESLPCRVGDRVGNRLAVTRNRLIVWVGSPSSNVCNSGKELFEFDLNSVTTPLVLNEVELNPQGPDNGREWIELYNPTDGLVDLYGWWIAPQWDRSRAFQIQDHLLMSPGAYAVIQHERLLFYNRDETVVLLDPDMDEIDRTPGPLSDDPGTSGDNRCWARVPDARDSNQFRDWKYVQCSPGLPNPTSL